MYASPKKHELMIDYVQHTIKYRGEGLVRKGWDRPFISIMPLGLYDVRIKKEHIPQFMKDLAIQPLTTRYKTYFRRGDFYSTRMIFWLAIAIQFFRFIVPGLNQPPALAEKAKHEPMPGWSNLFLIGIVNDMHTKDGQEVL